MRKTAPPISPENKDLLDFKPASMEPWYNPEQLARTGLRTIIASLFGSYSDRREMQACLDTSGTFNDSSDISEAKELWIDYVSDLGSGFNSTYAIAYLLGHETLDLGSHQTKRGNILVMGGDQVYPVPNSEEYGNRLVGPYRAARSYIEDINAPKLFVIPGNHDWYDGLTSFLKIFCQQRWIGAWKTEQTRSYFAVKLPFDWWIWGVDIQLSEDIDKPQQEYFKRINQEQMKDGDKVILCTSEPSWVYQAYKKKDKSFLNLEWFTREYITHPKAGDGLHRVRLPLTLTGDLHHYSSYFSDSKNLEKSKQWKITSGGGGAFLHPTHHLPKSFIEDKILLNQVHGTNPKHFNASKFYPDFAKSRMLLLGNLAFPWKNRWFSALMGTVYILFSWILASASGVGTAKKSLFTSAAFNELASIPATLKNSSKVLKFFVGQFSHHPFLLVFAVTIIIGFLMFADRSHKKKAIHGWIAGILHSFAQILLLLVGIWIWVYFTIYFATPQIHPEIYLLLANLVLLIVSGFFSGLLMGFYLMITNGLLNIHETEAFSSMRNPDYKNFVRMHLTKDELKIYPVKVDKVPRKWDYKSGVSDGSPWFEPAKGQKLKAELIEEPISIN
jgi:hypothetical protein